MIPFYQGVAPDSEGRFLKDIWAFDDTELETCHNYIQWLFPNREPSRFNPDAPLLTEEKIDPQIKSNIRKSFQMMLRFYGLTNDCQFAPHFKQRAAVWLTPHNHNFLRITRILKCLRAVGLKEEADAFLAILEEINRLYPGIIADSYTYWKQ